MLIGLSGYAGSGKDTVGNILVDHFKFTRVAFADKLKVVARRLHYWNGEKDDLGRLHLQTLGQVVREELGEFVWVNAALEQVDKWLFSSVGENEDFVVTDVRYPNEIEAIKVRGGQIWRVVRNLDTSSTTYNHPSEALRDFDPMYDKYVYNLGTIDELRTHVINLMS